MLRYETQGPNAFAKIREIELKPGVQPKALPASTSRLIERCNGTGGSFTSGPVV